jgi:hypothetical protein
MRRIAALAAMAAILLAACGGGGGKKTAAKGSTTTVEETTTTVAGTSTTAAAGAAAATPTTKAAGNAPANSGAKVNGQSSSNYTPPAGATAAKPAAPGTYTYDNQPTGTNTFAPPATSPLTVDPPAGTVQHSTVSAGSGKTETTLDYRPDGVHIVDVKLTSGNMTFDFVGNPPPLAAPTGAKPGQSVDFDLADNAHSTTIHIHVDFVRTETVTIGGQPVDTLVLHQVGTLSGQLTGTQTQDIWASQKYSLFVKTHSVADVKYQVYRIQSDVTSTLEKVTPG